ncbi:DNA alkylation repair protein [Pseudarthrobacter sulfonivorans]|uniref:DNA alkylation repair protein n=1 Tax=Pseudarthrobacter sulfonivorans TaxID=121292 RepID=UPI001CC2EEDD|nr:DNA alkylation repair protein [Pseudarthrobacter sulfonivorans]
MNELINRRNVEALAGILGSVAPGIRWSSVAAAATTLDELSLRGRTDQVCGALLAAFRQVPGTDYSTAAGAFRRALDHPGFAGWILWPVSEAAVTLALESDDPADFTDCLALLAELTPRLTGEFAIRRLIARNPSEYVRRSVANHLNDLARHSPETVVATAAGWLAAPDANTAWVVRHGLRTLIKKGHPGALALQGFAPASVAVTALRLDRQVVAIPEDLGFEFEISNTGTADARLAVDYAVHYQKANGSQSVKIFKLTALTLAAGETRKLAKRHAFKPMTTRVHHSGLHALELQVNGVRHSHTEFEVRT